MSDSIANRKTATNLFQREYGHFIGGEWTGTSRGATIVQSNPANRAPLAHIQAGDARDVALAVDAAHRAFPAWARTTARQRQEILLEMAARLRRRALDFALMESINNGKTINEAIYFDLPQAYGQFEFFAGVIHALRGESHDYPDALGLVHREPLGVCAQIIPWNAPLVMLAYKLAPALAAGNCVVMKPAETVCLSILEFMKEVADLVPPGVINIVTGFGQDVGEALVTNPKVRKVAFTGSTTTARKVMQYASANLIPQAMELGGKSAQIVCPSADLDAAAEAAALSTVFNKGEVCMAGSRLFVHRSVHDEFVDKLVATIARVRQGDPLSESTQIGAMASEAQFGKVAYYLDLAREEGATVLAGGEAATEGTLASGYYIKPTILGNVSNDMRVAQEEIFGPVTCVIGWDEEADMLAQVNDSRYGLAGGIWSRDLGQAHRLSRAMETGIIWVNRYYNLKPGMPIGGYKESGFGREGCMDIMFDYTTTKSVIINLDEGELGVFTSW
ncbi:aldehyde dehydrogenase family protein [Rhizorhabdus dicambivorans]|uniref:Aldehyde dehydrogenase n=1 Tax=Rhizorhabdus dicambivorans TaxID=1850238 RepID=A0A2A4FNC3_9SPHN|nr:aldehyde dehydrogenase family protein [Rhizorhabdus dicambivorans]ATE65147.1 aldehyde dehydrogenase [Rhizorhabdus dicambivorans]PCE39903.1 aldehyde dehydrogenase [Rhizorhabdus dicambivorans]